MAVVPRKTTRPIRNIPDPTPFQTSRLPIGAFGVEGLGDVGKALGGVGNVAARIALNEQATLNARLAKEAIMRTDENNILLLFGDDQTPGHYSLQGDAAVASHSATLKAMETFRLKQRDVLTNDVQRRLFDNEMHPRFREHSITMGRFQIRHKQAALIAVSEAKIANSINNAAASYSSEEAVAASINEINRELLSQAELSGFDLTNPNTLAIFERMKRQRFTQMFTKMVLSAREREGPSVANALLDKYSGRMERGAVSQLRAQLKNPKIIEQATIERDKIISDPKNDTAIKRNEAVRKVKDAFVQKELSTMMRAYNITKEREERGVDKQAMEDAIAAAYAGKPVSDMTSEQQRVVYKTPGTAAKLDKEALLFLAGRPRISDPRAEGELVTMFRDDKKKLAEQNFTPNGPWHKKLSFSSWKYWVTASANIDRKAADIAAKDRKAVEKSNNERKALLAAKNVTNSFGLNKEQFGEFSEIFRTGMERQIKLSGKPFSSSDAIELAKSIYISGEIRGTGWQQIGFGIGAIFDPDVRVFEARAEKPGIPISIVDFDKEPTFEKLRSDTSKKFIRQLHAQVARDVQGLNLTLDSITIMAETLLQAGLNATPFNIKRLLKQVQEAGKIPQTVVIGGETGATTVSEIDEDLPPRETPAGILEERVAVEKKQIIRDEGGDRSVVYKDGAGLAGGVGHKLTLAEAKLYPLGAIVPQGVIDRWFESDMAIAAIDADVVLPDDVPTKVFNIVVNMAFNLGRGNLAGFKGMLTAIKVKNYKLAAEHMTWQSPTNHKRGHTPWFNQTGGRAKRLIKRMKAIK